ncbi:MAG: AI-2E family transporter [Acidobacteria bacterium]|nr:MAG: AI-2E family transporter [Acidobacteriota bacterium]
MTAGHQFRKAFLLLLALGMTIVLGVLLQAFLLTIVVAAVMAGLFRPIYRRLRKRLNGRTSVAAGLTVLLTLLVVIVPLLGIGGLVVGQAAEITANVSPIIEKAVNSPNYLDQQLRHLPGYEKYLKPYRKQILTKAGEVINSTGGFLVKSLSSGTLSTVAFFANFFLALYAMYFFLIDGPGMLSAILDHLPLHTEEKALLTDRFMSVTRATIKGTVVIGVIQGSLTGLAFWVAGIPNVAFWTVLLIVLSIIPVIGGALIWVPACIVLFAMGSVGKAILLALFCSLIVGSVDNVLRPWLVGRDTKLHDLVILFSTMGGLLVIGPLGFIIGPVLAGLFVTSWQIFGNAFRKELAQP